MEPSVTLRSFVYVWGQCWHIIPLLDCLQEGQLPLGRFPAHISVQTCSDTRHCVLPRIMIAQLAPAKCMQAHLKPLQ